jgi:hypothetical protein
MSGIAYDLNTGVMWVMDKGNGVLRKIENGIVSTFAGSSTLKFGFSDGLPDVALLSNAVWGIALDLSGNIILADSGNNAIRKVDKATGLLSTIAGSAGVYGFADGPGSQAQFRIPFTVTVDPFGNIIVGDSRTNCIRKIDKSGISE